MPIERLFWNLHARTWDDELDRDRREARIARFASRTTPGERVLDLGCGTGAYARLLGDVGLSVVGVDFAPAMLARARAHSPHACFVQADLNEPLPFGDAEFDHALCIAALQCVRDPHRFLGDVRRVVRPGGLLLLAAVAHGSRGPRPARGGVAQHAFWAVKLAATRTPKVRRYTRAELTALLHAAHFDVVEEHFSPGIAETLARAAR